MARQRLRFGSRTLLRSECPVPALLSLTTDHGRREESDVRKLTKLVSNDLFVVVVFSGIGLLISLIVAVYIEPGLWL